MPDTSRSVAANANHVTVAGDDAEPSMMPTPNSRDIPTESTMTTREPRSDSHSTPPKAITPLRARRPRDGAGMDGAGMDGSPMDGGHDGPAMNDDEK